MRSTNPWRWLPVLTALALFSVPVALTGCGDDDDDDGGPPAVTFAPVTSQNLAKRTFVFTDLVDPGVTSTVTIGEFSGVPPTAAISVDSDDGSLVSGTIALGSCDVIPTIAVVDGEVFTGEALSGLGIEPALFDPCEAGSDGTLRLTDDLGDTFTSQPGAAAQVLAAITVPLSTQFQVEAPNLGVYARDDAGTATLALLQGNVLSYTIDVPNLDLAGGDFIFMAHIHAGSVVSNGPIDITLANQPEQPAEGRPAALLPGFGPTDTSLTASVVLTPEEADALLAAPEGFYVNVHSDDFPAGLVRGQLGETIALAFNVPLSVADVIPLSAEHATALAGRTETGFATLRVLDDATLPYRLRVDNLAQGDALQLAHIHEGAADANGAVFITLAGGPGQDPIRPAAGLPQFEGATTLAAEVPLTTQEVTDLGDATLPFYVQIHSTDVPQGLVRGQIRDAGANIPPTADAGPDQTVTSGDTVTLSGSGTDSDGTVASLVWDRIDSTGATLTDFVDNGDGTATFTAPTVTSQTTLAFRLTVTDDAGGADTDTVNIVVNPVAAGGDPINGGVLFTTNTQVGLTCSTASCHGPDGNSGPAQNLQGFTAQQIAGNPHGATFTQQEFDDIAAFLGQTFVTFSTQIQQAIFTPTCATIISCHVTGGAAPMSLQAGQSIGNLVDQPATSVNSNLPGTRVIPFNSADSRLMQRINGTLTPQMPFLGTPLSAGQQTTIQLWIDQGAIDN